MKRILFLLIMIFSISCNIVINPDILNPNHNKKTYKVTFVDEFNNFLGENTIEAEKSLEEKDIPVPLEIEGYIFYKWNLPLNIKITEDKVFIAFYKKLESSYHIFYETFDKSINYLSKDEMVICFLRDFCAFVQYKDSFCSFVHGYNKYEGLDGVWKTFIGGKYSYNNRLLYNNDIDANNDDYFLNSSMYKNKWYGLAKYIRDDVCKGNNHRFGSPENDYYYGSLDFVRYLTSNPDRYLNTYGGEKVFYGFPQDDLTLVDSYNYNQECYLTIPNNEVFVGWYKDKDYTDGPYIKIKQGTYDDIKLYAKYKDGTYRISFNTNENISLDDMIVSKDDDVFLPTLNIPNGEFVDWYLDGDIIANKFTYVYDCDITLNAKWYYYDKINNIDLIYDGKPVKYYDTNKTVEIPEKYIEKDNELRAVWISSIINSFEPSSDPAIMKKNLIKVLDTVELLGLNAVIFHVRTHNNAFYKTKYAPIDEKYGTFEQMEKWDWLNWFISECHKRNIEFHAWLNPYRIIMTSTKYYTQEEVQEMYKDYPLNPASKADNIYLSYYSGNRYGAILDPSKEEVRNYIIDVVKEIVQNYDVDGIHFDDYFYTKCNITPTILDDTDQSEYERQIISYNLDYDKNSEKDKEDWRRENVNKLIQGLHKTLSDYNRQNNKSIQFGISPSSVYKSGDGSVESGSRTNSSGHFGAHLYCDTLKWVQNEWIDYIMPQVYGGFTNENISFADITSWWNKAVEGTRVNLYFGIGIANSLKNSGTAWETQPYELLNQLKYLQGLKNCQGVSYFSFTSLITILENEEKYIVSCALRILMNEYYCNKASVPLSMAEGKK